MSKSSKTPIAAVVAIALLGLALTGCLASCVFLDVGWFLLPLPHDDPAIIEAPVEEPIEVPTPNE